MPQRCVASGAMRCRMNPNCFATNCSPSGLPMSPFKTRWVAFEVTSCGFACGPVSSTTWTVLDLNCSAE